MRIRACVGIVVCALLSGCVAVKESQPPSPPELERTQKPTAAELAATRARASTELAAAWFQRGEFKTALEELENAVNAVPEYPAAHGLFGLVYHAMRDDARAEEHFKRALAAAPNDPEIRTNYGWFLCRTQREVESVLEFERAADNPLYRTPELALQYAAQCASRANKMLVAETFYKRMAAVVPDSPIPHIGLAEVTYRIGRYHDARNHLRTALRSPQVPAHALALGACIESRLGDKAASEAYVTQLKNRFPGAVETLRASNGDCD